MDYADWFCERLAELRTLNDVSARDMSLAIGQSESYINKIENRRMLPSLQCFFYICEYFHISPAQFFYEDQKNPKQIESICHDIAKLPPEKAEHVALLVNDLITK